MSEDKNTKLTEQDSIHESRSRRTEAQTGGEKPVYQEKKKHTQSSSVQYVTLAAAAAAFVAVVTLVGGFVGERMTAASKEIPIEVLNMDVEATEGESEIAKISLNEDAAADAMSIVLETEVSQEEVEEESAAAEIQSILEGYNNLGIADVSGYLNVRKTPESYGEVVGELDRGAVCEILDESHEGWYHISSGGVEGYVSAQYVHTGDKAKEMAQEFVAERAIIQADRLNVRTSASQDADIVGQVYRGERYEIKSINDGWVQIENGFVSADYVETRLTLNEARKQDMRTTVLSLYDNLGVSNVTNYLNIRKTPGEDGEIVGKLESNAGCDILETAENGWLKIRSGNVTGYVKGDYILTGQAAEEKAMQVAELWAVATTNGVNVRSEPNTESSIWTQIASNERFHVVSQQDGWVEIDLDDTTAFISSDYMAVRYGLNEAIKFTPIVAIPEIPVETTAAPTTAAPTRPAETTPAETRPAETTPAAPETIAPNGPADEPASTEATQPSSSAESQPNGPASDPNIGPAEGQQQGPGSETKATEAPTQAAASSGPAVSATRAKVVNYALQFVGNPYVYGGTSLTNGADCSGFVQSVMKNFGVSLPRVSRDQAGSGKSVSSSNMQPGDLIFYAGSGGVDHVAMYIGGGQIVHASNRRTGITISNWNYRTPAAIRNVLD